MKHMKPMLMTFGQIDGALRRNQCRLMVPNPAVVGYPGSAAESC